jgi:hypothetical protein
MEYTTGTTSSSYRHHNKKNPFNTFLKKVAATTTKSIERGMHHLAVKADQGRTPDMLVLGLVDITSSSSSVTTLLSVTEPEPIVSNATTAITSSGIQFRIPLLIPNTCADTTIVQLQLFVRSGAALVASKYYPLAVSTPISVQSLRNALQPTTIRNSSSTPQQQQQQQYVSFPIRMNSIFVLGGLVSCIVVSDHTTGKFPKSLLPLPQRGWSLQDPNPVTAYRSSSSSNNTPHSNNSMFHLPLDQTYFFPFQQPQPPTSPQHLSNTTGILPIIQATERTVESTVILPIATIMAKLVLQAAQRSLQHMMAVRNDIYHSYRHDCIPAAAATNINAAPAFERDYADVTLRISHLRTNTIASSYLQDLSSTSPTKQSQNSASSSLMVSVVYQRPDSIFETELLSLTKLPLHPMAAGGLRPDISCHCYPQPIPLKNVLPALMATASTMPSVRANGFVLGNVRIQITLPQSRNHNNNVSNTSSKVLDPMSMGCGNINTVIDNPFDPMYITTPPVDDTWECIIPLDLFLPVPGGNHPQQHPKEFPVYNIHGQCMGSIVISFTVTLMLLRPPQLTPSTNAANLAAGGLVSMVGLTNLIDGILPTMDFVDDPTITTTNNSTAGSSTTVSAEQLRRRSQLATMGHFVTYHYLDQHIQTIRHVDCEIMKERAIRYEEALCNASSPTTESVPSYHDRAPKPFRPSSSRNTMLLSGIGFNVHTATMSLDVLNESSSPPQQQPPPSLEPAGAVLHNITCGAPADHARGFGNVFATGKERSNMNPTSTTTTASTAATSSTYSSMGFKSPIGPVVGGLRRLEGARKALADDIQNQQTMLIMSIANYFVGQRQKAQSTTSSGPGTQQRPTTHVPVGNEVLQGLRSKIFEAVQCLHHLTWICAVRRASVFSQTLGIAVSSYLSSVSDRTKQQSNWPELWTRHGFLVSYEGLLSAAGKELGMIEDASVGINMLRMVRMIFVPDAGTASATAVNTPTRVVVPHSHYLRWIDLTPQPTSNGQEVEYILQIGIDQQYYHQQIPAALKNGTSVRFYPILFEVGVDIFQAASNLGSSVSRHVNTSTATATCEPDITKDVVNDDEDEDVVGISDDDVLVQLNYEAFQKMNAYAQAVAPAPLVQATPQYQTHPLLATLFQHIVSSSGKMNHEILAEAAALAQRFSGGIVVFCKSGKDRTAMHLTYKQAQFINRFRQQSHTGMTTSAVVDNGNDHTIVDTTLNDAMLIRLYGTRLPICEKNVGQAKYAFNSLQVKFMPDALKPPPSALAGFLKGGKVFGGGGGIES